MKKKTILYSIGGAILCAVIIITALWFKPHRKATDGQSIPITARALFQKYSGDEQTADALYLGQVLEVTGTVNSADTDQDGHTVLLLSTGDPAGRIVCTFSETPGSISKNKSITVKGFCSGMLDDVLLTDCILVAIL